MLVPITLGSAVVLGVAALYISSRPSDFRVSRSKELDVPPELLFRHVNNLRNWNAWSPWAKLDPNAGNTFEGSAEGPGASMSWRGNRNVGEGTMTITDSVLNEEVRFRLDFRKPFKATNNAEFRFERAPGGTLVTWSMYGPQTFMAKLMGLVMNCDKMVGTQFEKGLADLGHVAKGSQS